MDENLLTWIQSYTPGRPQKAQKGGVLSEEATRLSGVLYMNNLPAAINDSAFPFENDLKMVFILYLSLSQSSSSPPFHPPGPGQSTRMCQ